MGNAGLETFSIICVASGKVITLWLPPHLQNRNEQTKPTSQESWQDYMNVHKILSIVSSTILSIHVFTTILAIILLLEA